MVWVRAIDQNLLGEPGYSQEFSVWRQDFRMVGGTSTVNSALRAAMFGADFFIQREFLRYTLDVDQDCFPDCYRFTLYLKGVVVSNTSGGGALDFAKRHLGQPAISPLLIAFIGIIVLIGVVFAWNLYNGGLWAVLGGKDIAPPSPTTLLLLAGIITLGVVGVVMVKSKVPSSARLRGG